MRALVAAILLASVAVADETLATLLDDLGSPKYGTRDVAYRKLVKRRDPRVIPMIVKRMDSWAPENQYRAFLVVGVFPPKQSHPMMRRYLRSVDPHLRICAATQLHSRGERAMVPHMVEALRTPHIEKKKLGSMIARIRNLRQPMLYDAWCAYLTPGHDALQLYVWLNALSSERYDGAQEQAKRIVAEDKRHDVRAVACTYLVRWRDADSVPTLAKLVRQNQLSSSGMSRVHSILVHGSFFPDEVCDAVLERLPTESNQFTAVGMIRILDAARYFEARETLAKLIEHPETIVATAALATLAKLGGVPEAETVQRLLRSKKPARQLMAARVLRRMDDQSGFDTALRIAKETKDADLREDAINVLGEFRRVEAIDVLIDALADDDGSVRSDAARALLYTLHAVYPFRRFDLRRAGYDYRFKPAERAAGVERIRAWWTKNRDAGW